MIKVSVIVPVYKVEQYLKECVDSIVGQTYPDIEIFLVDDGSPDACPKICDEYAAKDNRIKVIHQENAGLSQARNAGIKAATGDYLLFVDSDDKFADCGVVQKLVEFLQTNESTVTYCCSIAKFENGDTEYNFIPAKVCEPQLNPDDFLSFIKQNRLSMAAWTFAVRRDYILNHNLFFYPGILYEDIEWFSRLLLAQPDLIVNVFTAPYYLYRNNPASITHSFGEFHLQSYKKVLDLYKEQMKSYPQSSFLNFMFNSTLYSMVIFSEKSCLTNSDFFKKNRPVIKSLFRQNYNLLTTRNKVLYYFIVFSPKLFFILRRVILSFR